MEKPPFTVRGAAKFVLSTTVSVKTADLSKDVITDYTAYEEDDLVVRIAGGVIGWYVSDKLRPITDGIVDKTFDFVAKKRAERAAKKETDETDK